MSGALFSQHLNDDCATNELNVSALESGRLGLRQSRETQELKPVVSTLSPAQEGGFCHSVSTNDYNAVASSAFTVSS